MSDIFEEVLVSSLGRKVRIEVLNHPTFFIFVRGPGKLNPMLHKMVSSGKQTSTRSFCHPLLIPPFLQGFYQSVAGLLDAEKDQPIEVGVILISPGCKITLLSRIITGLLLFCLVLELEVLAAFKGFIFQSSRKLPVPVVKHIASQLLFSASGMRDNPHRSDFPCIYSVTRLLLLRKISNRTIYLSRF